MENFLFLTVKEQENYNAIKRTKNQQLFIALFENLPQMVLQLYESFELGYTYGPIKTFSVVLSIILFQKSTAQLIPQLLESFPACIRERKYLFRFTSYLAILFIFVFPYCICSVPFIVFFHPNQASFYKEHNLNGKDWDQE